MKRLLTLLAAAGLTIASFACAPAATRIVVAEFADVGDLVTRSHVQQSDSVVGTVLSIDLIDRENRWIAQVRMRVDEGTRVTQRTRAVVRSTSLLGERYVDLEAPVEPDPPLGADDVIPVEQTAKAPDLEAIFSELGGILATGALEDLAKIASATAMIVEGQETNIGRVIEGTANLVDSISSQREALASALDDLASASQTLAARAPSIERGLDVSDDALAIVAGQNQVISDLIVQLDRLAAPLARLTREHSRDIDAQVRALIEVVPRLHEVRDTLGQAVAKLPDFTRLFAEAAPGDYIQLDVFAEALPIGSPSSSALLAEHFLEATR